jgi:hypothetical protein
MTLEEAFAYLTPHRLTADAAPILLTSGKAREAIAAIKDRLTLMKENIEHNHKVQEELYEQIDTLKSASDVAEINRNAS